MAFAYVSDGRGAIRGDDQQFGGQRRHAEAHSVAPSAFVIIHEQPAAATSESRQPNDHRVQFLERAGVGAGNEVVLAPPGRCPIAPGGRVGGQRRAQVPGARELRGEIGSERIGQCGRAGGGGRQGPSASRHSLQRQVQAHTKSPESSRHGRRRRLLDNPARPQPHHVVRPITRVAGQFSGKLAHSLAHFQPRKNPSPICPQVARSNMCLRRFSSEHCTFDIGIGKGTIWSCPAWVGESRAQAPT